MAAPLTQVDPSTPIGKVVGELDAVRAPLDESDGIAVFTDLYRQVTALVSVKVTDGTFQDPAFVEALDVIFASYFLAVPKAIAGGTTVPKSWQPLVEARGRKLFPLQFALAGMNAHINHDLAVAVVATCKVRGVDPNSGTIHADFDRINAVLAQLEGPVRQEFLDKSVAQYGAPLIPLADLVANFSMEKARDAAWASAETMWAVRDLPLVPGMTEQTLADTVALVSRQLLIEFVPL